MAGESLKEELAAYLCVPEWEIVPDEQRGVWRDEAHDVIAILIEWLEERRPDFRTDVDAHHESLIEELRKELEG